MSRTNLSVNALLDPEVRAEVVTESESEYVRVS